MKILHICLASVFADGFSYQENELPKFHKALGYEVEVIASPETFNTDGMGVLYEGEPRYINENGIPVTRLSYKSPQKIYRTLRRYTGFREALEKSAPDILFIHGCQFLDIDVAARYAKEHSLIKVFVDNHADLLNSAKNFVSKNILHKIIWKRCAKTIEPYTAAFYGVVPLRVDFLKEVYGLPEEKCRLLVMGADDDAVERASADSVRKARRAEYEAEDGDRIIVTGGKLDSNKPQVLDLMKAVNEIGDEHIKLMIFGSVSPELKDEFDRRLSDRVCFVGWRTPDEIYEDFAAADIVAFPGLHSVLWEQAVGMGKPCLFKRIKGFEHIDLGGNCMFFESDGAEEYASVIKEAVNRIDSMKATAADKGMSVFSYRNIAQKALEG